MARKTPFRHPFPAVSTLAALAALAAGPAGAAEVACRESHDYVVEVDGEYPPDARFYETDTHGKFLVDIPSRSKSVLIDVPRGRAIPVPRTSLRPETIDGTIRVGDPDGSDAPISKVTVDGAVLAFQIDTSQVRVLKATARPRVTGSTRTKSPAAEALSAKACLGIESRPTVGIPGCGKWVYITNSCEYRVEAWIQRTEHLFSGTLPQTFPVVVPPVSELSLGCAWWNGAMAPTGYELLAAGYFDSPTGPVARDHHRDSTRH